MANISRIFRQEAAHCSLLEEEGRLFVESDSPAASDLLSRVFGLVSYSAVNEASSSPEELTERCVEMARDLVSRGSSFAVRVRRVGDHAYTSMDIAREAGTAILSAFPELKVDLVHPDWEVNLEIRAGKAYLYSEVLRGPGGLPLGTQGKVVAYVEEPDGVLAAWLMMKRGCSVISAYLEDGRWAKALKYWDPDSVSRRVYALEQMRDLAQREDALGFVYPWDLERLGEGTLRPAFLPLIGLSDEKLEKVRQTVLGPMGVA